MVDLIFFPVCLLLPLLGDFDEFDVWIGQECVEVGVDGFVGIFGGCEELSLVDGNVFVVFSEMGPELVPITGHHPCAFVAELAGAQLIDIQY